MKFRKIYVEISNICNLKCSFCPGTKRVPKRMTAEEFSEVLPKIRPYTDFVYFHIMGEPLLHPELEKFISLAGDAGFKVILTTNGTLVEKQKEMLINSKALHRINISLHAFEANDCTIPFDKYIDECCKFGKEMDGRKIVVYRLWNGGGADKLNEKIIAQMKNTFSDEWKKGKMMTELAPKTFLEYGEKFDWPDLSAEESDEKIFCYGLRDQLGILCDGTVVPCCLDHEGDINLGNIFEDDMEDILSSNRAKAIYNGFTGETAVEELCRKCGYARKKN